MGNPIAPAVVPVGKNAALISLTVGEAQNGEVSKRHVQDVLGARRVNVRLIATVHIEVGPGLQVVSREALSRDEQNRPLRNIAVRGDQDGGLVVIVVSGDRSTRRTSILHGEVLHFAFTTAVVFGRRKRC